MATPIPTPHSSSLRSRPLGVIIAESYFITLAVFATFKVIVDLDVFTRLAPILNLHFLRFFAGSTSGLIQGVLSVFAVVGLQRMRPWGRWLAIILAATIGVALIWFYSTVLIFGLWTLVPHHLWPYVSNAVKLGFGIYVVWYLFQPETRREFQSLRPRSVKETETNSWYVG